MFIQMIPSPTSYFDGLETVAVDKLLKVVVTSSTAAASGTPTPLRTLQLLTLLCSNICFHSNACMLSSNRIANVFLVVLYAQSLHIQVYALPLREFMGIACMCKKNGQKVTLEKVI